MGFIPIPWNIGDKITKSRLDRIEQGISDADITVPGSPAATAAGSTYVTFTDTNGNALPAGHVVQIRLTADLTDIDNIVAVAQ